MRAHQTIREATIRQAAWRGIAAVALSVAVLSATLAGPAGAAVPATADPTTAAGYAGRWLAASVTADGFVPAPNGDPSPGGTLQASLALAAARVDQATFERTLSWLEGHVDAVTGTGASTDAGAVGYLLLIADAAGQDPTDFGGVNLVTRLGDLISTFDSTTDPGLYGASDPTYDGAYRQSVAILGLAAAGAPIPSAALAWLTDRQCGTTDPLVRGAWPAYRLVADACVAGDPVSYTGVDTNDTALAASALAAAGVTPTYETRPYLEAAQNATGGWGFVAGAPDDPNSTAVVIQALAAQGLDPAAAPFVRAGGSTPFTALLGFQLGCDADPADQGAFTYPGSDNAPSALATEQAIWGAMAQPFPLGAVTFADAPLPCAPAPTAGNGVTTTAPAAGGATPVETSPAFTG